MDRRSSIGMGTILISLVVAIVVFFVVKIMFIDTNIMASISVAVIAGLASFVGVLISKSFLRKKA